MTSNGGAYMDISYFQKINNTYGSKSKQEVDLYLLNKHVDDRFADTIDYHIVKRNGEPFELLIIKDTDNNTFKKKIKSKHSTPFNLGDYIEWNNQIWLVTLLDSNDKTYHSGYMYLCTVPLRWQNAKGEIVERWAYSEDFTKYSSGISSNNTTTVGDNQYGLTLPIDEETKTLKRDMRFPIDFDDAEEPEIYKLTNRKVMLNNNSYFDRGGTMIATMSFNELNKSTDKRVAMSDGKEVWICNYTEPTTPPENDDETTILSGAITGTISGNKNLKVGFSRTYTAILTDNNGHPIQWTDDYYWNIYPESIVELNIDKNKVSICAEDETLIGRTIRAEVRYRGVYVCGIDIEISEAF
jgi:hypothetical protein